MSVGDEANISNHPVHLASPLSCLDFTIMEAAFNQPSCTSPLRMQTRKLYNQETPSITSCLLSFDRDRNRPNLLEGLHRMLPARW